MAHLRCVQGINERIIPLDRDRLVIGRLPECDVVLAQREASRMHAAIVRDGADYYVEDLGSRNGTFVNGERVEGRRQLRDGDEVSIGNVVTLRFHTGDPDSLPDQPANLGENEPQILLSLDWSCASLLQVRPETKLAALLEILGALGTSLDVHEVMQRVLDSLARVFPQMDYGLVLLYDAHADRFHVIADYRRGNREQPAKPYSETLARHVLRTRQAVLSADVGKEAGFDTSKSIAELQIRSIMSVPLFSSTGEVIGMIELRTNHARRRFVRQDLEIFTAVARAASVAIENARLHQVLVAKERLERELELARDVQESMLPELPLRVGNIALSSHYAPARVVSGDFYDFIRRADGHVVLVLGDVAGKGMPAALLMVQVLTEFRTLAPVVDSPDVLLRELNGLLCQRSWADRFVTLITVFVDYERGILKLANAAHPPALHVAKDGRVELLGSGDAGLPLGVTDQATYPLVTATLAPGDSVLLYTDGVTDAMSPNGTAFGLDRVRQIAQAAAGRHPAHLAEALVHAVEQHVRSASQFDDQCLIAFGFYPSEPGPDAKTR